MQRINFTMPKFKDHEKGNFISFSTTEKRVWKQGQKIFCTIFNYQSVTWEISFKFAGLLLQADFIWQMKGCSSNSLAWRRGTRYLIYISLHFGILYSSQQLICFLLQYHFPTATEHNYSRTPLFRSPKGNEKKIEMAGFRNNRGSVKGKGKSKGIRSSFEIAGTSN